MRGFVCWEALIFLGMLVSLSFSSRAMSGRAPLLAFALVAFSSTVLCYCTSIRAYGLAALLVVPCIVAFWRVARCPSRLNVAGSLVLALLVTHSNFQNSYLLFAIGVAGASVCALSGHWRRSVLILGIGFVAAVSLLVYIPTFRGYHDATMIQFVGSDLWTMLGNCVDAIGSGNIWLLLIWAVLLLAAVAWSLTKYVEQRRSCLREPSIHLFVAIAIVGGVAGGLLFFRGMNLYVNPWHVTPLIAFLAVLVDCGLSQPPAAWVARCKAPAACLVIAVSLLPAWRTAQVRRTTLDLVSQALAREAASEDLVLVYPFYLAPGFNYHYHGPAPWSTLPVIPDDENVRMFPAHGIIHVMQSARPSGPPWPEFVKPLPRGGAYGSWAEFNPRFPGGSLTSVRTCLRHHNRSSTGTAIHIP